MSRMNSKLNFRSNIIVFLITFTILIQPDFILNNFLINQVLNILIVIVFFCLLLWNISRGSLNFLIYMTFVYFMWRSFSSYYYTDGVLDLFNTIRIISILLAVNIGSRYYFKTMIKSLNIIFTAYLFINLITLFSFPTGIYTTSSGVKGWFLGIENQIGFIMIPAIVISIINNWLNKRKFILLSPIIVISLITALKVWSATTIVSMIFVFTFSFFTYYKKRKISFFYFTIFYSIIWYLIIVVNKLEIFEYVIVNILQKDLTLSFRIQIWDTVLNLIPLSRWYGYGINTQVLAGVKTYFVAHNMILQTILDSGTIGLLLFLSIIFIVGINLQKNKNFHLTALLLIGIFGILIGGLTESYRMNFLFMFLAIAYNVTYLKNYINIGEIRNKKEFKDEKHI